DPRLLRGALEPGRAPGGCGARGAARDLRDGGGPGVVQPRQNRVRATGAELGAAGPADAVDRARAAAAGGVRDAGLQPGLERGARAPRTGLRAAGRGAGAARTGAISGVGSPTGAA